MNERVKINVDDVAARVDELRADIVALSERVGHLIEEGKTGLSQYLARGAEGAQKRVSEGLETVGGRAHELADQAKAQVQDIQKRVEDDVSAHPLRALAIAAGVGLLLGFMSRSR